MSQVQLFKAPNQTLVLSNGISETELAALMGEVCDIFFIRKTPYTPGSIQSSISQVNEMVGNNLLPSLHQPSLADNLAVLAKQVPIILSEVLETLLPATSLLLQDTKYTNEELVEELINGFADIIYTAGGYAARLGEQIDLHFGLPGICRINMSPYYQEIMVGVCGEQMSKFIKESDINLAKDLFAAKGIEITITPGTGDWFVIKSAKDQTVNGEHYPEGKWLKGPHFQKYKLPNEYITHFLTDGNLDTRINEIAKYFLSISMVTKLTDTLDKLNEIIVASFGSGWKMNLAKRNKIIISLAELKEFYSNKGGIPDYNPQL